MNGREQTRWHSQGISADHRPGRYFHGVGKSYREPPQRHHGIPPSIAAYIATGVGARPARAHVEPDGYAEVVQPIHKPCITEGCKNWVQNAEVPKYCYTCQKKLCAENYRKKIKKRFLGRAVAC